MNHKRLFVIALLGLQLLLSACSDGGGGKSKKEIPIDQYGNKDCPYQVNDGLDYNETLKSYNSNQSQFVKTHFNKEFEPRRIVPLLKASIDAINTFVEKNTNLSVHAVQTNSDKCKLLSKFNYLNDPDKMNFWKDVNKGSTDKSYVAGVYLNEKNSSPFTIIRDDANKYTLIHEYMHFVFDTHRIKHGDKKYAEDIKANLDNSINELDRVCSSGCRNSLENDRLLAAYENFANNFTDLLIAFPIEEMTIESMLIEAINSDFMTQTEENDVRNAYWYISSSADKAVSYINDINQYLESRKSSFMQSSAHESSADDIIQKLELLRLEVMKYKKIADAKRNSFAASKLSPESESPHKSCAHNHDFKFNLKK